MKPQPPERQPQLRLEQTEPIPQQVAPNAPVTVTVRAVITRPSYPPYDYHWQSDSMAQGTTLAHVESITLTAQPAIGGEAGQKTLLTHVVATVTDLFGQNVQARCAIYYRPAAQPRPQTAPMPIAPPPPPPPPRRASPSQRAPSPPPSAPYVAPPIVPSQPPMMPSWPVVSTRPPLDYQAERQRSAMRETFVTPAVITMVLYFVMWLPGVIANITYLNAAGRARRLAGRAPEGIGCLRALLVVFVIIPIILLTAIIIFLLASTGGPHSVEVGGALHVHQPGCFLTMC